MSRTRHDRAPDQRDRCARSRWRSTAPGEGAARHGRRLSRPHARPAGPPRAASTSTCRPAGTCRPAPTTPPRTPRSCSGRRSMRRSAIARASSRYGSATVPMDEARASCAIDISGRPFTLFEAELPPGSTGGFDHELTEEFFRALANTREADAAPARGSRHQRPPHDRGGLQGVRAGAAPGGRDRPDRDGRAEHEGYADVDEQPDRGAGGHRGRRLRHGQPPLGGEGARARRRAREHQQRPGAPARRRRPGRCRAWARFRARWRICASSAWTSCCASASRPARRCSGFAWACSWRSTPRPSWAGRRGWESSRARCAR